LTLLLQTVGNFHIYTVCRGEDGDMYCWQHITVEHINSVLLFTFSVTLVRILFSS